MGFSLQLRFRKLKNRMSAQQARDRKKLYVSELEERVAQLEKEVRWSYDNFPMFARHTLQT